MDFNFSNVAKREFTYKELWDHDAIRVAGKTILVGSKAASRLFGTRKLSIDYDANNKAIRLTPDPKGFSFSKDEHGRLVCKNSRVAAMFANADYTHYADNIYIAK